MILNLEYFLFNQFLEQQFQDFDALETIFSDPGKIP